MVRCWTRSENRLEEEEEEQCTDGGSSHFQHKVFWVSLTALLLLIFVALGLIVPLRLAQPPSQLLQIVRISAPDQVGALINQSAVVDQQNDLVTFSVTSHANQTSTVLFDVKHGLICYKPANQESCFLQEMEQSDHDNVNSLYQDSPLKSPSNESSDLHQIFPDFLELPHNERGEAFRALECFSVPPPCLNSSAHLISSAAPPGIFLQEVDAFKDPTRFCCSAIKTGSQVCRYDFMEDIESVAVRRKELQRHYQLSVNETQRQTEFLGVLAAPQVNTSSLEDPLRALCRNGSIHWTRRAEGPSKQRLVYFCIDICFPSNICVSVCFYYLPE